MQYHKNFFVYFIDTYFVSFVKFSLRIDTAEVRV